MAGTSRTVGNNAWFGVVPRVNTVLLARALSPRPSPPQSTPGRDKRWSIPVHCVGGQEPCCWNPGLFPTGFAKFGRQRGAKGTSDPSDSALTRSTDFVPNLGSPFSVRHYLEPSGSMRSALHVDKKVTGFIRAHGFESAATAWAGTWLSALQSRPHQAEAASQLSICAPCGTAGDHEADPVLVHTCVLPPAFHRGSEP